MEKVRACPLADGFDIVLCNSILMVGVGATEGELLPIEGALCFEGGGGEEAIV